VPTMIQACALCAALTLLAGCGSSNSLGSDGSTAQAADLGTAPVSPPSGCELAAYPSLQWATCEAENVLISQENELPDAEMLPQVLEASLTYQAMRLQAILADPARQPNPNSCTTVVLCPIDPRLQDWAGGGGLVQPILYTSRSGATMSGHVWATKSGPAKRPGVVIINGSIIGYEQPYWYAAQALAKAGFLVMTFDPQGEGMSDQFGQAPDQLEDAFAGIPVLGVFGPTPPTGLGLGGNGLPFYDGGEDALDFFLSTPANPYMPVPSRTTGTSHNAKQQSRVASGLDNAYNPLWQLLDPSSIGLTGHSYGAIASSWLAQQDPRVSAEVAWDSLCVPTWPSPDEVVAFATAPVNQLADALPAPLLYGFNPDCFAAPAPPAPAISKPALGLNSDYLLAPVAYLAPPRPEDKTQSSLTYSGAGVDSGNIVIRGGTHLEYDDAALGVLPSSLRGIDMTTWYTVAWFAKYLQHDPNADTMLLSARWRDDAATAAVDPGKDGNLYSWHYKSRLDVILAGGNRYDCENLRDGCAGQFSPAQDCGLADYSFVAVDTAPDGAPVSSCQVP
jgi:dienelactone hydrolase